MDGAIHSSDLLPQFPGDPSRTKRTKVKLLNLRANRIKHPLMSANRSAFMKYRG